LKNQSRNNLYVTIEEKDTTMTNTPIQVTTELTQVLEQINRKLDKIDGKFEVKFDALQKEVTDFRSESRVAIEQIKGDIKVIDEKVNGLKTEVSNLKEDVKELKGSQKAQIWSLIVLAFTAVLGIIGALARVLFVPNP
jgi:chromosome segregation ATPase